MSVIKKTTIHLRGGPHIRDGMTLDHLNKLSQIRAFFKSAGEDIGVYLARFLRLGGFSRISTARPCTERFQNIHSVQTPELRWVTTASS